MKFKKGRICVVAGLLLSVFILTGLEAQTNKSTVDLGADLVSRNVWRGIGLTSSPAIQPFAEFSKGGLTLGAWGSYTLGIEQYQEVDLYVTYSFDKVAITLFDYFTIVQMPDVSHDWLNWSSSSTLHAVEAQLEFTEIFSSPFSFMGAVIFFGDDTNEDSGENYFSTYLELDYDFGIDGIPVNTFIGFTPGEGLYSDKAALVNLGFSMTKEIELTEKFSLPITGKLAFNPSADMVFMVAGISL